MHALKTKLFRIQKGCIKDIWRKSGNALKSGGKPVPFTKGASARITIRACSLVAPFLFLSAHSMMHVSTLATINIYKHL